MVPTASGVIIVNPLYVWIHTVFDLIFAPFCDSINPLSDKLSHWEICPSLGLKSYHSQGKINPMNSTNSHPDFQPEKHEISVSKLKQKLDCKEPLVLLDVREPHEHEIVHIQGAQLIPLNELPQNVDGLDNDAEIVIYCHHGMRSMYAATYLYQNGFQNVKSLTGGIDQWAIEIDKTLNRY